MPKNVNKKLGQINETNLAQTIPNKHMSQKIQNVNNTTKFQSHENLNDKGKQTATPADTSEGGVTRDQKFAKAVTKEDQSNSVTVKSTAQT